MRRVPRFPDLTPRPSSSRCRRRKTALPAACCPIRSIKLPTQLYSVVETKTSIIHGDLNLQNILVDAPTGFAWLIDFAETRVGPTLLDLQRLEVQVITKLMPGHGEVPLVAVADMMTRLHADPPLPPPPLPALQEPYALLVTIRRLVRQYLIDDLDWNEYYYGLVTVLIGTLKYDELDNTTRAMAFVAAATVENLIGKPLRSAASAPVQAAAPVSGQAAAPAEVEEPAAAGSKRGLWVGVGVALAAVILAILFGWQFARWSSSSPDEPASAVAADTATDTATGQPAAATQADSEQPAAAVDAGPNAATATDAQAVDAQTTAAVEEPTVETPTVETPTVADASEEATTVPATEEPAQQPTEQADPVAGPPAAAQLGDIYVSAIDDAVYIFIPGGEFSMGSDDGRPDEGPAHGGLDAFWIMRNEVTNGQYARCVAAGACTPPSNDVWEQTEMAEHPITNVTWEQADRVCNLGRRPAAHGSGVGNGGAAAATTGGCFLGATAHRSITYSISISRWRHRTHRQLRSGGRPVWNAGYGGQRRRVGSRSIRCRVLYHVAIAEPRRAGRSPLAECAGVASTAMAWTCARMPAKRHCLMRISTVSAFAWLFRHSDASHLLT